uniref:Uncharacterized protein n=1 Tax=Lactuca sativa TaxID=4236 RepID=A0A9R1XVV5_LACSA|nr:hypothetical protein LSAT_V11C100001730 [Lactuca sativa]
MPCYAQSVSELRSDAGDKVPDSSGFRSDVVSSGLRSDAGDKVPVSSGLRFDVVGKAQYVFICYCMVCGSLRQLTKLRAYSFSFGFSFLVILCYGFGYIDVWVLFYGIDLMILVMIKQKILGRIVGRYRYIQGTLNHGIHICVYSISSLISYIDVDLGVALIHDILRLAIALGDNLIPWSFKRQPTLS